LAWLREDPAPLGKASADARSRLDASEIPPQRFEAFERASSSAISAKIGSI
jgi:hypothetical protein